MDIVHPRVAGLDVHKKVIWVAVRLPGTGPGERTVTVKRYRTFWRELKKMAAWLIGLGVTDAALESTGVCWWPVYHALAQAGIEVCVCNAAHMPNVPGRKRDIADSGSPSCTSTGCCGPASSPPQQWRSCGPSPATAAYADIGIGCVMPRPALCRYRAWWPGRWRWPGREPRHNPGAGWSLSSLRRERRGS
jgi:Transposase